MSRRRPKYDPANYEPCPVGCGRKRWLGSDLPVCSICEGTVMDAEWAVFRSRLVRDFASLDVLIPLDKAIVADCKESLRAATSTKPLRRRYQ